MNRAAEIQKKLSPEQYAVELVLALGKPAEQIVTVPVQENGSTAYFRDEDGTHYIPKRSLEEILIEPKKQDQEEKS